MKKNRFKYLFQILLIVGICIYAFTEFRFNSFKTENQIEYLQKIINSIFLEEQGIIKELELHQNTTKCLKGNYYFGIYKNDSLIKWNNPDFILTENISSIKDGQSFQHLSNGYYLVTKKSVSSIVYAVFKPIYTHYNVTNRFLKNEWLIVFENNNELEIIEQPTQQHYAVKGNNNEVYFYLQPINNNGFYKANLIYLLLFGCVLILVLINITLLLNSILVKLKYKWLIFIYILIFLIALYGVLFYININFCFLKTEIFNPEIYASKYFKSLGQLAVFSLLIWWALIFITLKTNLYLLKNPIKNLIYSIVAILSVLLIQFSIYSLVNDSSISFSVFNTSVINIFSIIAVVVIAFQISILFFLVRIWFPKISSINFSIAIVISFAIVSAYYFNFNLKIKELEIRKLVAKKLTDERDIATEFLFKESYDKIQKDNYLKGFLLQDKFNKNECIKYLKQRYFKGYFDKYNVEFYIVRKYTYISDLRFKALDSVCVESNKVFNGLYYLENKNTENQYFSKIFFVDSNRTISTIFISFNPKLFKKDKIYPSLIVEQKANNNEFAEQIDFAVYSNNQLIKQSGSYSFPFILRNAIDLKKDSIISFDSKNIQNLILKSESGKVIWVVNYNKELFQFLSLFGILLILLVMIGFSAVLVLNRSQLNGSFFSFRNKVLIAICSITLLILISSGILFSVFYARQYNDLLKINLSNKINNVQKDLMLSLESSAKNKIFHTNNESSIDDLVHHLSDVHDVDINLFNDKGSLISSSQSLIYENGILNPKINYYVFNNIVNEKKSLVFNDEKIGKLSFKAAYIPITDAKNNLKYILSVPYFFREKELTDNFNNLVITLVNVYLLLILVAIITAIFISNNLTKSFKIIREKLSALKLGKRNEPIVWQAKDEIGSLVAEYNKMIAELENSTSKLAQSERESAWREMARQVAHEIKNPLTPMKLSIQLLERAIKDKRDDVNEMTIKVSKTLIEQIDNLTQIATQFSQFARISSSEFEIFDLNEILKNIVDLFQNQNELIEIKLQLDSSKVLINADKNQCVSVFNNIVLNAIQSIPENENGKISIHQFEVEDVYVITITDNGCGIEEDKLERIFEPNFTTKSSGTGLGLAIAKTIIENANGKISLESKVGEGTIFKISFPKN